MSASVSEQTSVPARWCLGILVAGYVAMAAIAGAPNSPLTVLLPAATRAPWWATSLARAAGLDRIGRPRLIGVSWILVLLLLVAFVRLLGEAWSKRIRLPAVLVASGISLAVSMGAPLLLSRDVYTYAAYGRIETLYHHDPYVAPLASFPHDPFVAVTSTQWLHTRSNYGPVFTLASAAIARTWPGSPSATILAFKLMAGLAIAAATGFVALTATRIRPDRAPLAVALIGLNPVIVMHTVGGGHVDALIALPLAAAAAIAVTLPRPAAGRAIAVTVLLTVACLIKVTIAPALALWLWWLVRDHPVHRGRILAGHLAMVAGSVLASVTPFIDGWHTLAPFGTLGGIESWASPSQLVGRAAQAIVGALAGSRAGGEAAAAVEIMALLLFVVLAWRLAQRTDASDPASLIGAWGAGLLLLALSMPFLLPWYAAWFVPFIGLFEDKELVLAGAVVTGVLGLTLIPADPFRGFSTPGVMNGVHYGAASVLLVVLLLLAVRILGDSHVAGGRPTASTAAPGDRGGRHAIVS